MPQPPPVSAKPHALVVERSFGIQHFVRNLLSDVCDTDAAFSAAIAYAMLEGRSYDLIITSLDLPRCNHGLNILNAAKASSDALSVPVIGLTSNGLAEDRDFLLSQGFAALVPVWPDLQGLRPTVLRILDAMEIPAVRAVDQGHCV